MNKEEFINELLKLNITLSPTQIDQLDKYYKILIEWNNKINLTRIIDEKDVYLKHFYDSITLFRDVNLQENVSICDVGTGAGFPGLVLKIVFPNLKVVLVDALEKRIKFLNAVINELNLKNIETYHDRGEIFARNHREEFDIVTSRAVANLKVLSEICLPMVKVNGLFVPMKGNVDEEVENAKGIISHLNSNIEKIDSFQLPFELSNRNIIVIRKNKKSSLMYPRSYDKIKKIVEK